MTTQPRIALSRLRDIAWTEWDPIGLLPPGEAWDQKSFSDEYDAYLLKVAEDLRNGGELREAAAYLVGIAREHMAMGVRSRQEARAETTVRAIQACLTELDEQHSIST